MNERRARRPAAWTRTSVWAWGYIGRLAQGSRGTEPHAPSPTGDPHPDGTHPRSAPPARPPPPVGGSATPDVTDALTMLANAPSVPVPIGSRPDTGRAACAAAANGDPPLSPWPERPRPSPRPANSGLPAIGAIGGGATPPAGALDEAAMPARRRAEGRRQQDPQASSPGRRSGRLRRRGVPGRARPIAPDHPRRGRAGRDQPHPGAAPGPVDDPDGRRRPRRPFGRDAGARAAARRRRRGPAPPGPGLRRVRSSSASARRARPCPSSPSRSRIGRSTTRPGRGWTASSRCRSGPTTSFGRSAMRRPPARHAIRAPPAGSSRSMPPRAGSARRRSPTTSPWPSSMRASRSPSSTAASSTATCVGSSAVGPEVPSICDLPTGNLRQSDLEAGMHHDASGVDILLAPPRLEMADLVSVRDIEEILQVARRAYQAIVIDTPSALNENDAGDARPLRRHPPGAHARVRRAGQHARRGRGVHRDRLPAPPRFGQSSTAWTRSAA